MREVAIFHGAQHRAQFLHRGADGHHDLVEPVHHAAEITLVLGGVGAQVELALDGGLGQEVGIRDQGTDGLVHADKALGHDVVFGADADRHGGVTHGDGLGRAGLLVGGLYAGIEVELDLVVLALVLGHDHRRDIALGDAVHIVGGDVERVDDVGHGLVDAQDQLVPAAHKQGGIRPLVELAVGCALDDDVGLRQQVGHHLDHGIEVALDDVVLALVLGGDGGGNDALGNFVHIVSRHVHRIHDIGDGLVDARDQLVPAAHKQGGVGTLVELAVGCALDDDVGLRQQVGHHLDHVVKVALDDVEVAVVVVGDDRWNHAFGDVVHIFGGDVEWANDGV